MQLVQTTGKRPAHDDLRSANAIGHVAHDRRRSQNQGLIILHRDTVRVAAPGRLACEITFFAACGRWSPCLSIVNLAPLAAGTETSGPLLAVMKARTLGRACAATTQRVGAGRSSGHAYIKLAGRPTDPDEGRIVW